MVIGLLAVTAIPTTIGVGQAISAQKRQNAASREQEKVNLMAMFPSNGSFREAGYCVLIGGKASQRLSRHFTTWGESNATQLLIDLPDHPVKAHRFCGYYFKYPSEEDHLGLVSTIAEDPPMLNWIFANQDSHAVEFGGRKDTMGHVIGPWGWTDDGEYLTLKGKYDTFVAVEMSAGGQKLWAMCWDPDGQILEQVGQDKCKPLRLRRKPLLGMESKYVKD